LLKSSTLQTDTAERAGYAVSGTWAKKLIFLVAGK
jgi:hypothetical protein